MKMDLKWMAPHHMLPQNLFLSCNPQEPPPHPRKWAAGHPGHIIYAVDDISASSHT